MHQIWAENVFWKELKEIWNFELPPTLFSKTKCTIKKFFLRKKVLPDFLSEHKITSGKDGNNNFPNGGATLKVNFGQAGKWMDIDISSKFYTFREHRKSSQ